MRVFTRIAVIESASFFASCAMRVMLPYLMGVWQLSPTHASGILSVWNGINEFLPIIIVLFLGALGNFRVLLISNIAFTIGLGCLSISAVSGPCHELKRECIGYNQKVLFYTALALLAVGIAGHLVSLEPFIEEQTEEEANDEKVEQVENPLRKPEDNTPTETEDEYTLIIKGIGLLTIAIACFTGIFSLHYIKSWSLKFGLPAIFTLVASLLFSTIIFSKSYRRSSQSIQLTMISPRMIPILLTFIICGLVLSSGNTYFLAQATTMSHKLGRIEVPHAILTLLFHNLMKTIFKKIYIASAYTFSADVASEGGEGEHTAAEKKELRVYAPAIFIGIAMTFSILSCITAAKIESQRLQVIRDHGLQDKPDETVPMSAFKLFPQFLLLAAFDGLFGKSTVDFFIGQRLQNMSSIFIGGAAGIGIMGSVLSVYVVGKVSERGGRPNWFQENLNNSRLDMYYWTLAALSSVNLVFYILVACFCYRYEKAEVGDEEEGDSSDFEPEENGEEEEEEDDDDADGGKVEALPKRNDDDDGEDDGCDWFDEYDHDITRKGHSLSLASRFCLPTSYSFEGVRFDT